MPADKSQPRKGYAVRVGLEAFVWSEAALLSLTVAKNAVAPQADPSTLERVSMAKASVIGVQMRAAHRPLTKIDEGVAKCTRPLCGQTSSGSWGSGKTQRHVEAGWQAGSLSDSFSLEASGGCVQAIYEGMDPRRSEGLGDEDWWA